MSIDLTAFTDEIAGAFEEAMPCAFATCGLDGPDVTFKGSALVLDSEHLAFWETAHGATMGNLRHDPRVVMLYRSPGHGVSMRRFFGVAEIYPSGEMREQVRSRTIQEELEKDPDNTGIAVVIRVDRVLDGRRTVQERDPVAST